MHYTAKDNKNKNKMVESILILRLILSLLPCAYTTEEESNIMASSVFYFGEIGVNDYIFALFSNRTAEFAASLVPDIVAVTRSALNVSSKSFRPNHHHIRSADQLCIVYAGRDRRRCKDGAGDGDDPAGVRAGAARPLPRRRARGVRLHHGLQRGRPAAQPRAQPHAPRGPADPPRHHPLLRRHLQPHRQPRRLARQIRCLHAQYNWRTPSFLVQS